MGLRSESGVEASVRIFVYNMRIGQPVVEDGPSIFVECREPPESDQPCLVLIQLQPILAQMLLQFPELAL